MDYFRLLRSGFFIVFLSAFSVEAFTWFPGMTDQQVCESKSFFVRPDCSNQCSQDNVCKEIGVDVPNRRVRCYQCVARPPVVAGAPEFRREKGVLHPFGSIDQCQKVRTFSKVQPQGDKCLSQCPADKECRPVDVCAGAPARCPGGARECPREQRICDGTWITCFNCEEKPRVLEVKKRVEKKAEVGPAQVRREVVKAEIPTEVVGICNEASKQFASVFESVIAPPAPEGCSAGCKFVKFNVPSGSARCCCCGPCKPAKPLAAPPRAERPSPQQVCAQVQQRASEQGVAMRVFVAGGECNPPCRLQDLKIAKCCACPL